VKALAAVARLEPAGDRRTTQRTTDVSLNRDVTAVWTVAGPDPRTTPRTTGQRRSSTLLPADASRRWRRGSGSKIACWRADRGCRRASLPRRDQLTGRSLFDLSAYRTSDPSLSPTQLSDRLTNLVANEH